VEKIGFPRLGLLIQASIMTIFMLRV